MRSGLGSKVTGLFKRSLGDLIPKGRGGSFLAIDIGSSCVKLVETDGSAGNIRIIAAGIAPLPPTAVQNNLIQDPAVVASTIRDLVRQTGARSTEVITAVPGPAVMIKKLHLRAEDEANLENHVMLEAGNAIPESLMESELFGHEKGAFTGANAQRKGLILSPKSGPESATTISGQAAKTAWELISPISV